MAESRKVIAWVAGGCLGIVLLGMCCITAGYLAFDAATGPPVEQAHGFFADLRAGNNQGALARMAEGYRAAHDAATFPEKVAELPSIREQTDSTFLSRSLTETTAALSGTLTTPSGALPVTVTLIKERGEWGISLVNVGGVQLQ